MTLEPTGFASRSSVLPQSGHVHLSVQELTEGNRGSRSICAHKGRRCCTPFPGTSGAKLRRRFCVWAVPIWGFSSGNLLPSEPLEVKYFFFGALFLEEIFVSVPVRTVFFQPPHFLGAVPVCEEGTHRLSYSTDSEFLRITT